ncbi:MAG TPA: ABC transporter ATP-binding protein [Opitutaceae bacterium]|nr:ABC transporter ATP-binding protein [Opitutaceae bacterium]
MLSVRSVTKKYGDLVALNDVTLDIKPGEFFGLLGPNGAGKSTLMSLAAGLKTPDSGEVLIGGKSYATSSDENRRQVGFVPQTVALYEDLSAEQNLKIFGQLYGLGSAELKARIEEVLGAARLLDRRNDKVKTFSGGMQRRLNIAATLLHRPKILLCDEPTVGVDPQSRNAIFDHLQELNRGGVTIIYSTHYMEEAERLCSRIGIIDHGKILALGTLDVLVAQLPFEEEISFAQNPQTDRLRAELASLGQVQSADGITRFRPKVGVPLSQFYQLAEAQRIAPRAFTHNRPTLEALFLHLTGRNLRD